MKPPAMQTRAEMRAQGLSHLALGGLHWHCVQSLIRGIKRSLCGQRPTSRLRDTPLLFFSPVDSGFRLRGTVLVEFPVIEVEQLAPRLASEQEIEIMFSVDTGDGRGLRLPFVPSSRG